MARMLLLLLLVLTPAAAVDRLYYQQPAAGSPAPLATTKAVSYETCTSICHATDGCLSLTWNRRNSDCLLYGIPLDSGASSAASDVIWVDASWDNRCYQRCRKFDTPECYDVQVLDLTSTSLTVQWQFQTDNPDIRPYFNYDKLTSIVKNPSAEGHDGSYPATTETKDLATPDVRELPLSGLIPGMRYDVTIQMKEGSDVNFECETAVVSTIPISPVLSGAASGNQVTITWTQEGVVSKYEAWNSPADGLCASRCTIDMISDPSKNFFVFTGLITGKAYKFSFLAFGLVESSVSRRADVRVKVPPSVPAVADPVAETNLVYLTWTQPGIARYYHFWVDPSEGLCHGEPDNKCRVEDENLREFRITGLTPGHRYTVYVEAESNGLLSGPWSGVAITPPAMPTFRIEPTCYKITVFVDNPEGHTHRIHLHRHGESPPHILQPGQSHEYTGYDPSNGGRQSDWFYATSVLEPALDRVQSATNEQQLFADITNRMRVCVTSGTSDGLALRVESDTAHESQSATDPTGGAGSDQPEVCEWNTFDFLDDVNGSPRVTGDGTHQCFEKTCSMCVEYPKRVVFSATGEDEYCPSSVQVSTYASYHSGDQFQSETLACGGGCLNTADTQKLSLTCE